MIGVLWPGRYDSKIEYLIDQLLIDFIVYIYSSIGIWFGFFLLNPYTSKKIYL